MVGKPFLVNHTFQKKSGGAISSPPDYYKVVKKWLLVTQP